MSVSSSLILPGPFKTISVNPEIVVIVAPDVSAVDPSVGAEYPVTVAHWTPVPVVCKYCPFVPDVDAAVSVPVSVAADNVLPVIVRVLLVVATTVVSTAKEIVPAVPPPVKPVPAVTPEISPSFAVQAVPL